MKTKMQEVLEQLPATDPCTSFIGLMVNRRMNVSPGWRPSDAARAELHAHERASCAAYEADYLEGREG